MLMILLKILIVQKLFFRIQDRCTAALDIFDELIESEVSIVIPHVKSIAELCLALAAEPSLDENIRIKVCCFSVN